MDIENIKFSQHAIQRMFERDIDEKDILQVIKNGEEIKDYPNDSPYPSKLILGYVKNIPIHIVIAINKEDKCGIIITTYIPTEKVWCDNFKRRK